MNIYDLKEVQIVIPPNKSVQKLYWELTGECNLHCDMCFRHGYPEPLGSMNDQLIDRICQEIDTLPALKEIVLGGIGEPFLHPRLPDVIRFAKQRGKTVSITSNGTFSAAQVDLIVEQHLDHLYLSFETGEIGHANEALVFDLAKRIDRRKKAAGVSEPTIHLLMVVTSNNIRDLHEIEPRLRECGINSIFMSNLLTSSPEHRHLVLYPQPEPLEIKQFKSELLKKVLLDKTRCSVPKFEIKTDRYCEFIEQDALVVRWDGAVAPCYRFLHTGTEFIEGRRKEIRACTFGQVMDESLLEIWNRRDYAWFRYLVRNSSFPSCIDCQFKDGCEFIKSTVSDCWGNENSCADCLWSRGIIRCP